MKNIKQALQHHHKKHQHHSQLRIDFHYSELANSFNNTSLARKDIQALAERLVSRNYIVGYIWVLAFNQEQGLHAHALFYLNHDQHDALAVIAIESLWANITQQKGHISERDIEVDVVGYFCSEVANNTFQNNPDQFIGCNRNTEQGI